MISPLAQKVMENEIGRRASHATATYCRHVLSANQIRAIRASKQPNCMLAAEFGVSNAYISKIKRGVARKDVT